MTVLSSQSYLHFRKAGVGAQRRVPTSPPLRCFCGVQNVRSFSRSTSVCTDGKRRSIRGPTLCRDSAFFASRAVAPPSEEETTTQNGVPTEKFNWFKNWWPVQALVNLETDRPNKVQILSKDFIVWKGHSGEWIAMDDECPHRMAPLSEGRIEDDGNLLCSYHAWRFNESGKCVKIPHAEDEKAHSTACNSPRSAVQTYPCKTRGALMWIWPDISDSAFSDSEKCSVPMEDDLADFLERAHEDGTYFPFLRKYYTSYEAAMDNGCDPSHFSVTHHGLLPFLNREASAAFDIELSKEECEDPETLAANVNIRPMFQDAKIVLNLPSSCTYYSKSYFGKGRERNQIYVVPMSSTESMIYDILLPESIIQNKKRPNVFWRTLTPFLNLLFHFFMTAFTDADIALLHGQDEQTKVEELKSSKYYYIPTRADALVMAFRRWFETRGEYGAAYGGDQPIDQSKQIPREQLLDRFETHTKHCTLCRSALKNVEMFISGLEFLRLASLFATAAAIFKTYSTGSVSLVSALKTVPVITTALVLALSTGLLYLLQKLRSRFYYVPYDFAEKN